MNKKLNITFILLIALLFVPIIQTSFKLIKTKDLQGAYIPATKPKININNWFEATYQDSLNNYLNENFGFRNLFVRLNNQIDFSLFNKTNAVKIVIGKNGYLFEDNYLHAFSGEDFIGENAIDSLIDLAVKAQNTLKENEIEMLYVFAPGKASFFPEHVPNQYNQQKNKTNFEALLEKSIQNRINLIDLNTWFQQMKDTSSYPLYPK
ncbi:MAG: hypothetical protein GX879_03120, partial [Bacteroidales bacterium]|nr:hypothetical protein [Bacteroidales bacterium]